MFDETHWPLQETKPVAQTQVPPWQTVPVSHTYPQVPQFWLSIWTSAQEPLHSI